LNLQQQQVVGQQQQLASSVQQQQTTGQQQQPALSLQQQQMQQQRGSSQLQPFIQPATLASSYWPLAFMLPAINGHQAQAAAATQRISIGPGLPTIPKRLVEKMHRWEYIDLAELLPTNTTHDATLPDADAQRFAFFPGCEVIRHRRRQVENVLQWTQCFTTYVAAMAQQYPEVVGGMIAYLQLIVKASQQYDGLYWRSYDTHFRVNAAATGNRDWARMDTDLYTRFFTGRAKAVAMCSHCDGTSHKSDDCPLKPRRRGRSSPASTASEQTMAKRRRRWPDDVCATYNAYGE
jgi:hypothetical protein